MFTVTTDIAPEGLEAEVDAQIKDFDEWFQSETKNEPLVNSEKAILKTFLWYQLRALRTRG